MSASQPVFAPVAPELDFPREEDEILRFWERERIFAKSLEAREGRPTFVFYEGPPTANGTPHNGHVLTRVIKDLFPRYKTMRGFAVPRKAGWDTHGLPVEVEVEKELRIHGKAEIEKHGVEPFVGRCIESVFRYTHEWEKLTKKIGFWVDLEDAYVTYHRSYVESVWWALSRLFEKGLLYQGHKVVWWWAQGGTALSAAEVGQGYKTVDDPSAYVAFPLTDDPHTALLVWTTTPWTLPSNMYAAVKADVEYVTVDAGDRRLIVAAALRDELAKKLGKELPVVATCRGADLVGRTYEPPYEIYWREGKERRIARKDGTQVPWAWRVMAADFVTLDTGTGIVHIAPAFGEDDFQAHRREEQTYADPAAGGLVCAIEADGTFKPEAGPMLAGKWVKDVDRAILADLGAQGRLVHQEQYRHEYPFCWRADDDPLIQLARPAWYIRTTAEIGKAIASNQAIQWLPEHIKDGRFGDFLANNVDWALSRERYWGTPLPIWKNDATGELVAIGSLDELRGKPGNNVAEVEAELAARYAHAPHLCRDLIVHKPWIDKITFAGAGGTFHRVSEVIDCWFDSGCMPFAQWGFPHAQGSIEKFDRAFPADFISEAIDQTRGWFYSLLMVSTLVFDDATLQGFGLAPRPAPHPYRTCIVLGHVGDREGKKESKSKGNYTPPDVILERVAMQFAVIDGGIVGLSPAPGECLIAREDLEGLDLQDGAAVELFVGGAEAQRQKLTIKVGKKLPRRVVALHPDTRAALGATLHGKGLDVKPVEVPRIPEHERVWIVDPSTPAPGADGFRWFFYASGPPWTNTRHSLSNVRALQKDFQVKLRNVWSFFTIYANVDGWSPASVSAPAGGSIAALVAAADGFRPARDRSLLDRWILSELALAVRDVTTHLDAYRPYEASQRLVSLVDALSNWWVRRSRDRFWAPGLADDKRDAYLTLWQVLATLAQLAAPFVPFFADRMWQSLVRGPFGDRAAESVHLADWPEADATAVDAALAEEMQVVRELVSLGLQVRTNAKLKVRQPLARADIVLARQDLTGRVRAHAELVKDELNVEEVRLLRTGEEGAQVKYRLKPNFRALGPKLGKKVQLAKKALEAADAASVRVEIATTGAAALVLDGETFSLGPDEIEVAVEAAEGFAAAGDRVGVVVLHTELTEALVDRGLAREVLSRVQAMRKDVGLGFTDRIRLALDGSDRIRRVCEAARDAIARDALATEIVIGAPAEGAEVREVAFDGESLRIALLRAN